jgi:hypothetical protein
MVIIVAPLSYVGSSDLQLQINGIMYDTLTFAGGLRHPDKDVSVIILVMARKKSLLPSRLMSHVALRTECYIPENVMIQNQKGQYNIVR